MDWIIKRCAKVATITGVSYSIFVYFLFLLSYKNKEIDSFARGICWPMTYLYEQIRDIMVASKFIPTRDDYVSYLLFLPLWVFLFGFLFGFIASLVYYLTATLITKKTADNK